MNLPVITIEERPSTPQARAQGWLQGRRILVAAGLAVLEVVVYLIVDPSRWIALLIVAGLLAALIALGGRLRPGLARDVVFVGALAQGMVIALPVLAGVVQLVVAALLIFLLIALFVMIGLRFRR